MNQPAPASEACKTLSPSDRVIRCPTIAALRRELLEFKELVDSYGDHYEDVWYTGKTNRQKPMQKPPHVIHAEISAIRRKASKVMLRIGFLADSYPGEF
jgi:hypothetical protein